MNPQHCMSPCGGTNAPVGTSSSRYRHRYPASGASSIRDSFRSPNIFKSAPQSSLNKPSFLADPRKYNSYIHGAYSTTQPQITEEIELTTFDENHFYCAHANSSEEEFFEANEEIPSDQGSITSNMLSILDLGANVYHADLWRDIDEKIKPHMTRPLAPGVTTLDFSLLEKQRGLTNVFTATPLARVREFHTKPQVEECTLLNILADEFDIQQFGSPKKSASVWKTLKHLTLGVNADDFDQMFPWAKYSDQMVKED